MKKIIKSKKGLVLLGVLVVAAAGAIAGYAYFTSTGSGTGSATVGVASTWSIGQNASAGGPLYPDPSIGGANIQTDSYTVKNNGNGQQNLNQVVIRIADSTGGTWSAQSNTAENACTAADFSVGAQGTGQAWTDPALTGDFAAAEVRTGSVKVEMIDNGHPQDNCQGVTVPLYFSAN